MMDLDLGQLEALAATVSEGTFEAAARTLHVTPSAISQRIKTLEKSVGRVLVTRAKPVRPTASGEVLLRLARQIQTVTADVAREIGGDEAAGAPVVISLAASADSLATWLLPALARVGPPVVFDLHRDDEELTADLLRQGTVMAAVTAVSEPVPGCSVDYLGAMRYRPSASPAFVDRWFPGGVTPSALARAPMVVFDRADQLQDRYLRRRAGGDVRPPRHHVPGSAEFVTAVRLGLGWGMLPDLQTGPAAGLGAPRFVDLDPPGGIDVRLFWQQWKLGSAALGRVAEAVRTAATDGLR
jgi:LysR family transcriptional regulator (chromosome initiation inhibitor)